MEINIHELLGALPFTVPEATPIEFTDEIYESDAEWRRFMEAFLFGVAMMFKGAGGSPTTIGVFAQLDPSNQPIRRIVQTTLRTSTEHTKAMWSRFVKTFAKQVEARALVHISEVWHYSGTDVAGLRKHQEAHGGSYEGFEGVEERLMVLFERPGKVWHFVAPIIRDAEGVRTGDWEERPYEAIKGRFVGLLDPHPEPLATPV